ETLQLTPTFLLPSGGQINRPVNLDGNYSLRGFMTYGMPIHPIKSNINMNFSGMHSRTPSLINGDLNYALNSNLGLGLTLSSNISEKLDFILSSRSSYNYVTNSLQTNAVNNLNNKFLNQSTNARFRWVFWKGMLVATDFNHQV